MVGTSPTSWFAPFRHRDFVIFQLTRVLGMIASQILVVLAWMKLFPALRKVDALTGRE